MKLIKPSFEISEISSNILTDLEYYGRTCYKSENLINDDSAKSFIKMLIEKGHESVLEHEKVTVKFICDRGVSHELVRHRIASFSQESTRYCNYSKDKFDNQITFIIPLWCTNITEGEWLGVFPQQNFTIPENDWYTIMVICEIHYKKLIEAGWQPQQARSVLPNSLKTEIIITANLREWRLIFKQRTSKAAHPQMRELMIPLLQKMQELIPIVFNDIKYEP